MTHQQNNFENPAQASSKAMFETKANHATTEGVAQMKTRKIMTWVDELPGAASTEFPTRRDEIADLMEQAAELSRQAEELRGRAYFSALGLEGDARAHWSNQEIELAKRRAG